MDKMNDDDLLNALGVEVPSLKTATRPLAKNASSLASRTFSASIRPMAAPHYTAKTATSSSACTPCAWISFATYRKHKPYWQA